jgi:hypothetical protein
VVRSRGVQPTNKINRLDFPTGKNQRKSPLWRQTTIPNFSQPEIGIPSPPTVAFQTARKARLTTVSEVGSYSCEATAVCGAKLTGQVRSTARYCSDAHRQLAYRRRIASW